jgi:hypothetical protein
MMVVNCELDSSGSEEVPVMGCYVSGNETEGCVKCGKFVDHMRPLWILNKDSTHLVT